MKSEIKTEVAQVLAEYGSPQHMISYASVDALLGYIRQWYSQTKSTELLDILIKNYGENRPSNVHDVQNLLSDIRKWYGR